MHGKRPVARNFVGKVSEDWFFTEQRAEASRLDFAWAILRLCPQKLFKVDISPKDLAQEVPGWSGFHATISKTLPFSTTIGYCPMINATSVEFSTIYTVMKKAQAMMATLGQAKSVITFDLAIYAKAKEIQWKRPDEFSDTIIRMGGFHIALNFLALLGKKYENSGLQDLLVESGICGSNTATSLLAGTDFDFYHFIWNGEGNILFGSRI